MKFIHPMKPIVRATLLVLSLAAAGLPRASAAQTFTFNRVQWGEPRARVLFLFRGMGYELRKEDGGNLYFWSPAGDPDAVAILDPQGRLVAVMKNIEGTPRETRTLFLAMTDSVRGRVGPPTAATDSARYWDAGSSTLTLVHSGPRGQQTTWSLNVLYSGPGWEAVRDGTQGGGGAPGGFAPLDESRWFVAFLGETRRVSIDRSQVTPLGNDVFRVWERWEAVEPVQDIQGGWYDATLTRVDYDCRGLRMRIIELITYSAGRVVGSVKAPPAQQTWDSIVPESIGEQTVRAACPVLRAAR
jgi:hypothetical protein